MFLGHNPRGSRCVKSSWEEEAGLNRLAVFKGYKFHKDAKQKNSLIDYNGQRRLVSRSER